MRRAPFASGVDAAMLRRYAAIAMVLRRSFRPTSRFRASVTRGSPSMLVIDAAGASTTSSLVRMAGMKLRGLRGERLSPRITMLVVPAANAFTKDTPSRFPGLSGGSGDLVKAGNIYDERPGAFRPTLADSLAFSAADYVILCNICFVKTNIRAFGNPNLSQTVWCPSSRCCAQATAKLFDLYSILCHHNTRTFGRVNRAPQCLKRRRGLFLAWSGFSIFA